jgi:two-component system cell cycle response regulator
MLQNHPQATVLVADDSATVRVLVRMQLESAGYDVVEAEDGQHALDAARGGQLDAVLLDVEMPVMDGFQTIAALKDDPLTRDIPVVFLTSRCAGEDVVGALRAGAHDYLRKPPDPAELLARVAAAVEVTALRGELRRRTAELDRMSRTDHLTDLFNRRHLDESLQAMIASSRRHTLPVSVLLVDVDHFKQVNDRYGHEAGDIVLQAVAASLLDAVRLEDVLGRWGGEEFLVLAPFTDTGGALTLAERLRTGVAAASIPTPAGDVQVTISIGGATAVAPGTAVDVVLRAADEQLYAAKEAGRDRSAVCQVS